MSLVRLLTLLKFLFTPLLNEADDAFFTRFKTEVERQMSGKVTEFQKLLSQFVYLLHLLDQN